MAPSEVSDFTEEGSPAIPRRSSPVLARLVTRISPTRLVEEPNTGAKEDSLSACGLSEDESAVENDHVGTAEEEVAAEAGKVWHTAGINVIPEPGKPKEPVLLQEAPVDTPKLKTEVLALHRRVEEVMLAPWCSVTQQVCNIRSAVSGAHA